MVMSCFIIHQIDVLQSFDRNNTEVPVPNVKGVRWNYPSALAQSLKEVDAFFDKKALKISLTDQTIHTVIKDDADGLGEASVYKERDDKFLPDKALRFSFAVMSSHCILTNSEKELIYDTENPNSVRTNRPLFEVIADENNKASVSATLVPIERQREHLKDKILKVKIDENRWRSYHIKFFNSMIDEKHDRSIKGYQGSGSSYICVLCGANHKNCKEKLGTFKIDRNLAENKKLAIMSNLTLIISVRWAILRSPYYRSP